jgi:hypothetical protein
VLAALAESLREELAQARAELAEARERIAGLEVRLRQNPRNSSRPPSSEGLASQRRDRGRCGRKAAASHIRMAKLKQKVSGCLRTMTGARQFCTIRSYLSTAAKHGLSFFDALVALTEGKPWMPAVA